MKRSEGDKIASKLAEELCTRSWEELRALDYPVSWEIEPGGEAVQVELNLLEDTSEYLHISIAVAAGFLGNFAPSVASAIVQRTSSSSQ